MTHAAALLVRAAAFRRAAPRGFAVVVGAALLLGGSALAWGRGSGTVALQVRDADEGGRVVQTVRIGEGEPFRIRFTHSMYGGSVWETYRIVAGVDGLMLERLGVRTERGGAAEYYALYGNMRQDAGGWVVDVPPLLLPRLPLRVDRVGAPDLEADGGTLRLLSALPEGHLALIEPAVIAWPFRAEALS